MSGHKSQNCCPRVNVAGTLWSGSEDVTKLWKMLTMNTEERHRKAKVGRIGQGRVQGSHPIIHQGTGAFPVAKMCERGHMRSFGFIWIHLDSFDIFENALQLDTSHIGQGKFHSWGSFQQSYELASRHPIRCATWRFRMV